jgi:hypothetical protein
VILFIRLNINLLSFQKFVGCNFLLTHLLKLKMCSPVTRSGSVIDFAVATRVPVDAGTPVGADAPSPVFAVLLADGLLAKVTGVSGPESKQILYSQS